MVDQQEVEKVIAAVKEDLELSHGKKSIEVLKESEEQEK